MKAAAPAVGLLSWKDAARYLSLSESSVRRLVKAGEIRPPIPVTDGRVAFTFEDVEAYRQRVIARAKLNRM
jgi:excisionase family DNA binding protein